MMRVGLIVGSGVDFPRLSEDWTEVSTPYGCVAVASAAIDGANVTLIRRHGTGLNIPPHLINHHANIWALRESGVDRIVSTAAVGSMRIDMPPGTLAVVSDFVDWTRARVTTIYDRPLDKVMHTDFSTPYCPEISSALEEAAVELGVNMGHRVTYVCVDGPRYETPAEIRMFSQFGDVVGMTGAPEAIIAREMGICYGSLAILTNYAAGISDHPLSHEEVLSEVARCGEQVTEILKRAIARIFQISTCHDPLK